MSIAGEDRLLHGVVDGRAGVLVLDLVLELAELDLAGRVAQVGAVDRRAGLHADLGLAGQAVDGDVVDAGLALADDAGELDRDDRADAGGDAVLLGGGGLVGGDGLGERRGIDRAADDAVLDAREVLGAEASRARSRPRPRPAPSRSGPPWCRCAMAATTARTARADDAAAGGSTGRARARDLGARAHVRSPEWPGAARGRGQRCRRHGRAAPARRRATSCRGSVHSVTLPKARRRRSAAAAPFPPTAGPLRDPRGL